MYVNAACFVISADRGDDGFVSLNESRVTIRHDGHVTWVVPLIVHSACAVDVTYFPFDDQRCFVRFGSWIYDEQQVNLTLKETAVRLDSYSINTELDLLEVSARVIAVSLLAVNYGA